MSFRSALYAGHVAHHRLMPKRHQLRNRVYWLLMDLDELPDLDRRLHLFSHNRMNFISLYDRDHGDGTGRGLKGQMIAHLGTAGIDPDDVTVKLLAMPRVAGYDFNPLSIYFCSNRHGQLVAIIYEVNNAFGGRHSYVIPVASGADETVRQRCDKAFYVSPFMDLDMTYRFRTRAPEATVAVAVEVRKRDRAVINTSLRGRRLELTDGNLARLAVSHPLIPMKVMAAIYWNATKLWWRGFAINPETPSKGNTVTIVHANE